MNSKKTQEQFINECHKIYNDKYDFSITEYINSKSQVSFICSIHGIVKKHVKNLLNGSGCPECNGSKKYTREQFINECNIKFNNKYDYSLIEFKNINSKLIIVCPIHGNFTKNAYKHKEGAGCQKCSKSYKRTKQEFIDEVNELYNNKYDYSLINFINIDTNIEIICPMHGSFSKRPSEHLSGSECNLCKFNKHNITKLNFIDKSNQIHNNKYDYSLSIFQHPRSKIKIICNNHNQSYEFEQEPYFHIIYKRGCNKCSQELTSKNIMKDKVLLNEFINRANKVHNNKYDYSKVNFNITKDIITIICNEHNEFQQQVMMHLLGRGCSKCSQRYNYTTEEYINLCKERNSYDYDYSKVKYITSDNDIILICNKPNHGEFTTRASSHLSKGVGCPKCKNKTENILYNFILDLEYNIQFQYKVEWCKNKKYYPFDFYLPDLNLIIEVDGKQHFQNITKWNSNYKFQQLKDSYKMKCANNNNIKIIRIYQEMIFDRTIKIKWKKILENLLISIYDKILQNNLNDIENIIYIGKINSKNIYEKYEKNVAKLMSKYSYDELLEIIENYEEYKETIEELLE